jgi:hypothetical protein
MEIGEKAPPENESAPHYYRLDFTDKDKPFKDIRDFQKL